MELIFEILVEVVFEIVFALVVELLSTVGFHILGAPFSGERAGPVAKAFGYLAFGGILGGLSLLVMPEGQIQSELGQTLYAIGTPIMAGAMMAGIGWIRSKKEKPTVPIESFTYGLLFVLPIVVIRFFFAHT